MIQLRFCHYHRETFELLPVSGPLLSLGWSTGPNPFACVGMYKCAVCQEEGRVWLGEGDQTAETEEGFLAGLSRVVFFLHASFFFFFISAEAISQETKYRLVAC